MKIEAKAVVEAVEHFKAMEEQKAMEREEEAVSNSKIIKFKVHKRPRKRKILGKRKV